jgi:hypothetical protein
MCLRYVGGNLIVTSESCRINLIAIPLYAPIGRMLSRLAYSRIRRGHELLPLPLALPRTRTPYLVRVLQLRAPTTPRLPLHLKLMQRRSANRQMLPLHPHTPFSRLLTTQ